MCCARLALVTRRGQTGGSSMERMWDSIKRGLQDGAAIAFDKAGDKKVLDSFVVAADAV